MGCLNRQMLLFDLCLFLALVCFTKQQDGEPVSWVSQNFEDKLEGHLEQHILTYSNLELAYKAYAAFYDRADVDLPGFKKYFRKLEQRSHANAVSMTTYINKRGGYVQFPVVEILLATKTRIDIIYNLTMPAGDKFLFAAYLKDACSYIDKFLEKNSTSKKENPNMCNYHSQSQKSTGKKSYAKNVKDDSINWRPISGLTGLEEALTLEKFVNRELISLAGQAKFHRDPHAKLVIEAEMEHQVDIIKEIADLVTRLRQYPPNKDYELGEYLLDRELSK